MCVCVWFRLSTKGQARENDSSTQCPLTSSVGRPTSRFLSADRLCHVVRHRLILPECKQVRIWSQPKRRTRSYSLLEPIARAVLHHSALILHSLYMPLLIARVTFIFFGKNGHPPSHSQNTEGTSGRVPGLYPYLLGPPGSESLVPSPCHFLACPSPGVGGMNCFWLDSRIKDTKSGLFLLSSALPTLIPSLPMEPASLQAKRAWPFCTRALRLDKKSYQVISPTASQNLAEPRGTLVVPSWNPCGTLVEPYLRAPDRLPRISELKTFKLPAGEKITVVIDSL